MKRFSRVKFSFIWISLLLGLAWLVSACGGQPPAAVVVTPSIGEPKVGAPSPQQPGEEIGISIEIASTGGATLSYTWSADGGEIVRGQGSPAITYRVPQDPGTYNIRVKVEWDGQGVEKVTSVKVEGAAEVQTPEPPADTPESTHTPKPNNIPRPTPTPTATIDADPTVYDNFNNPANDGNFNKTRWEFFNPEGICSVAQRKGAMTFSMNSSNTDGGCFLFGPKDISGDRLQLFEAKMQISTFKEGYVNTKLTMASNGFSGGGWIQCGIQAQQAFNAYIIAYISVTKQETTEFERTYPIEYNRWYTIRSEVDPNSMTFSCFVDNNLIGTVTPEDAPKLKTSFFKRYIQTFISPNSSATTFVDDVRVEP